MQKLKSILEQLITDKKMSIEASSNLKEDLGLGSFQIIQLISNIQEVFDLVFEVSDYVDQNFVTVQSVQNLIEKKITHKKSITT